MRFRNRTIIVTGGLGGIGKACARRFVAEGANVLLADLSIGDAPGVVDDLNASGPGRVVAQACDVSREADVAAACDRAHSEFGAIDVIVNVAGTMIYKPIEELTHEDWTRLLGVNFVGAAMFTAQGFRRMRTGSAIVNVSSIHAHQTSPLVGPYAAAKAALGSLTRTAAIEGKAKGIRVNAVLPGAVDTPMLWASPNLKSGAETLEPGDVGQPDDIAGAVAYLASADAAFVTGASLNVDGGRLAKL